MKTSKNSKLKGLINSTPSLDLEEFGTEPLGGPKTNLWSRKAREDIFERRQKGEDWETICRDYPNRTRHAMQQQYSVMKRQHAPNSPRFTSNRRRGRKTRGSARGRWATVNKIQDSSEEALGSDMDLEDMDIDDDDDEEYDSDDAAEDDSHPAEEDPAAEGSSQLKEGIRPSSLGRSATEPSSSHVSIPRRATFPNLPGIALPRESILVNKMSQPDPLKRKNETEAEDSESRTSSHLSKRRKHSTEPLETFNHVPGDSSATLKTLVDCPNMSGMILYPEAVAKAKEDFRNLSLAYTAEKASRQETFEAALKRATRRANDAEHRLHDTNQSYADKIKVSDEAHAKALEASRQEVADLTASLAASRESAKVEALPLRAQLIETEARYDRLCLQVTEKLNESQTKDAQDGDALKAQLEKQNKIIDTIIEDWWDAAPKTNMQRLKEVKEDNRTVGELIMKGIDQRRMVGEAMGRLDKEFAEDASPNGDKVNGIEGPAATVVNEGSVMEKQPPEKSDGVDGTVP